MYCKKCGTALAEEDKTCPNCGFVPKKNNWWMLGVIFLFVLVGSFWGLNKLNIVSIDAYLSKYFPISMNAYFPMPSKDAVYVGNTNGRDVVIEFKFEDQVTIDGQKYFVRTKKMTVNDAVYPSFEFLYYDEDGVVLSALSSDEYGTIYNKSFDYDLSSSRDVIMPNALKLGESIKFESDSTSETYTLLDFKNVSVGEKKYFNTALIEIITYNRSEPVTKEWIYHAKNVGIVKLETYYLKNEGEWNQGVSLELK